MQKPLCLFGLVLWVLGCGAQPGELDDAGLGEVQEPYVAATQAGSGFRQIMGFDDPQQISPQLVAASTVETDTNRVLVPGQRSVKFYLDQDRNASLFDQARAEMNTSIGTCNDGSAHCGWGFNRTSDILQASWSVVDRAGARAIGQLDQPTSLNYYMNVSCTHGALLDKSPAALHGQFFPLTFCAVAVDFTTLAAHCSPSSGACLDHLYKRLIAASSGMGAQQGDTNFATNSAAVGVTGGYTPGQLCRLKNSSYGGSTYGLQGNFGCLDP